MANPLASCVSSLRSTNALLSSSISILDSGVSDFPRLGKVLQTTRVCLSSHLSGQFPYPIPRLNRISKHVKGDYNQLTTPPALRAPPRTDPPSSAILPPRLPHPRTQRPPRPRGEPSRQTRPARTSAHCADGAAGRSDRRGESEWWAGKE